MKLSKYQHKFVKVVTSKHVVELKDVQSELPKVEPLVTVFPFGSQGGQAPPSPANLSIKEAKELSEALAKVIEGYDAKV